MANRRASPARPPCLGLWRVDLATPPQIISQIRFAIEDQLSAHNAHHAFEHLCRHFARLRVCSNILPATGPVAAGGDQGRDFETFRTYIHESPLAHSSFVGLASEGLVVFGCSLQKDNIEKKVRDDIAQIMEPDQSVASIHLFWGCDIAVSRRHKLQAWARDHHDVNLEILDALALSELLCDPEIFWIAEQYLSIPREFCPHRQNNEQDNWYEVAIQRWTTPTDFVANPANFHELVSAIRHATFGEGVKSDLPILITRLREFQEKEECPIEFYWRAIYEIAVASLRGLGSMEDLDDELRLYFSRVNELVLAAELEDASVLAQYCWGAHYHNAVGLPLSEIRDIGDSIQNRLRQLIAVAPSITSKCMYLETLGFNCMMLVAPTDNPALPDLDEPSRLWAKMLNLVSDAPLYPLERFADRVTAIIDLIDDSSVLEGITNELDELLAKRFGGFMAAEKCRDRSIALQNKGQILRAINELHRAKIAWFAEETLGGSVLTMLMLSALYLDLGLSYAAKQYSMAAAYIAIRTSKKDLKKYVPSALMQTARCEYSQGSWCDFLGVTNAALLAYHLVPNQDQDQETIDKEIEEICYHTAVALMVAERFVPTSASSLEHFVAEWPFSEHVEEARELARYAWSKKTDAKLWDDIQEQMLGRPFGDVSETRTVSWKQIGLTWTVSWKNLYETTVKAEQFIATAQILMAEWAGVDLCLLRSSINVEVETCDQEESMVESKPTNKGREWLVKFSQRRRIIEVREVQREAFGFVACILREVSLLPDGKFIATMENSFRQGVVSNIEIARPYEELYRICITEPRLFDEERVNWRLARANVLFGINENPELGWVAGPGPGYTKEQSEEYIRNRYRTAVPSIRHILRRLSASRTFMDVVRKLKDVGWLDWHLVVAVANITWNYRAQELYKKLVGGIDTMTEEMNRSMVREEGVDDTAVPMTMYNEETVRMALRVSQLATLKTLGLECRQQTPDFDAIDNFLRERFNYWTDDVEHEDPFSED